MRRRDLITLLAGTALLSPRTARARDGQLPLVGFLDSAAATAVKLLNFYEGLKVEGYIRNQNVVVEYHSAEGDYSRLPALATDLVNRRLAVLVAVGIPAAVAAASATAKVPIVFAIDTDPVQLGLIPDLSLPGGNITGVANMVVGRERKRLHLLRQLVPVATTFALLVNPQNPHAAVQARDAMSAADELGLQITVYRASTQGALESAFSAMAKIRVKGLVIGDDEVFFSAAAELAALAARYAIPAVFAGAAFTSAGGLMSYGGSAAEMYHQVGAYSGLILKGAAAARLPVFQSTKVEFIINQRAAATLNLAIPAVLLARANEIIK